MATNAYGQNYSGNDDFRGWIAAGNVNGPYGLGLPSVGPLNAQGTAKLLLSHLGNDGRSGNPIYDQAGQKLYQQWQAGRVAKAPAAPNGGGGGGGYAAPAKPDKSNDIALQLAGLGAVDQQVGSGMSAIDKALSKLFGQYDTEKNTNEGTYRTQSDTNQGNLQKNKQTALVNASQGRQGLFGVLSSLGALNGSGIDLANRAVQKGANDDLSGAADNYGENQSGLDTAIGSFRQEDKMRRENADTAAENARTNVRNEAAKSRMSFYTNLSNDYAAMGDEANAKKYSGLASGLYPDLAKTSIPNSNIAYSGAAFTPAALQNYIAGADSTIVKATPTTPGGQVPGLVASPTKKKQLQLA